MVTAQRWAFVATGLLCVLVECGVARAAETKPRLRAAYSPGFMLGLRSGVGFPFGERAKVNDVTDSMGPGDNYRFLVPLWVDAGYRFSRIFSLGAYFQYGFLTVSKTGCPAPLESCGAHDLRAGAAVYFHILPDRAIDPWVGHGIGYEASTITYQGAEQSATRTNGGLEFANVQAGVDVHPVFGFDWGPFASFSTGGYLTESHATPDGQSKTYALSLDAIHYFFVIGMRAQCDL